MKKYQILVLLLPVAFGVDADGDGVEDVVPAAPVTDAKPPPKVNPFKTAVLIENASGGSDVDQHKNYKIIEHVNVLECHFGDCCKEKDNYACPYPHTKCAL